MFHASTLVIAVTAPSRPRQLRVVITLLPRDLLAEPFRPFELRLFRGQLDLGDDEAAQAAAEDIDFETRLADLDDVPLLDDEAAVAPFHQLLRMLDRDGVLEFRACQRGLLAL